MCFKFELERQSEAVVNKGKTPIYGTERVWEITCNLPRMMNANNGGPGTELASEN